MNNNYISIAELNNYIKNEFDGNPILKNVYLRGEISNFKRHTRGHLYFSLKDDTSKISAVMFYNSALTLNFNPEDGMNVLINGRVSCYEAQGTYQIYVNTMEQDGIGNLFLEYEKLKKKLAALGYFDESHKKAIPKYPMQIGVITASTGAAVRDIFSTIKRRFPMTTVILFPTLVQGREAAGNIAKQIKYANTFDLDVIICGRGGGSIEDLWAFNEEIVAKAIYDSDIPIISAVGHEVDYTIADYVADLRAPTPTGAAEMAVPNLTDVINNIEQYTIRLNKYITNYFTNKQLYLDKLCDNYVLKNPLALYEIKEQKLDSSLESLGKIMALIMERANNKYDYLVKTLKLVNPLNILENGYSLTTKDDNIVKSIKKVSIGDTLTIKVTDGLLISEVKEIINGK